MAEECIIVTFPSTHHALRAERIAREKGLDVKMIPVPREISSDCNMGMKILGQEEDTAKEVLTGAGVKCEFVSWPGSEPDEKA